MRKHIYALGMVLAAVLLLATPWKAVGDRIGVLWNGSYYLDLYDVVTGLYGYAPTREIWIAPRTDGVTGSGTLSNPYDVSTSAKLHTLLEARDTTSPLIVHWLPGTYHTLFGIAMYDGWKFIGSGQNETLVEFDGNQTPRTTANNPAILSNGVISAWRADTPDTPTYASNMRVSDMTIDCNAGATSSWHCAGVVLVGQHDNTIERVRVTNASAPSDETFVLWIASSRIDGYRNSIKYSSVDNCHGDHCSCLSVGGVGYLDGTMYYESGSSIENNYTDSSCNIGILPGQSAREFTVKGNYINGAYSGLHADTGNSTNVNVENNTFIVTAEGIQFGNNITNNYSWDSWNIYNNNIQCIAGTSYPILISGSVTNARFENNIFGEGCTGIGLSYIDYGSGTSGIIWEDNTVPDGFTYTKNTPPSADWVSMTAGDPIFRRFTTATTTRVSGDGNFTSFSAGGLNFVVSSNGTIGIKNDKSLNFHALGDAVNVSMNAYSDGSFYLNNILSGDFIFRTTGSYTERFRIATDGTITAGAGGFTVDADGDTVGRSLSATLPRLTAGSGTGVTVDDAGSLRTQVYKVTVAYTNFVSAGTTHDLTIATLPAKSLVHRVFAQVTTPFVCASTCTTATLSATLGLSAGGVEFLESFDLDASAAWFGDADAEIGSAIDVASATPGGYLNAAGSAVVMRGTSGTGNWGSGSATNLNAGSVTFYILYSVLP